VLSFLLQGIGLGISAALSPGPFQSIIIAQSLKRGWRQTLPIIIAPLIGDIPIAILLVVLLRQLPNNFLSIISLAGAILLLYLAWRIFLDLRSDSAANSEIPSTKLHPARGLLLGLSMLFLSPGPYLYWSLVLGPLLLSALEQDVATAIAFLLGFYLFSVGGLVLLSVMLSRLGKLDGKLNQTLRLGSLVLMLLIAMILIARTLTT
jgi:threonine/homoserine/homoserine lactone efflux protein